MAVNSRQVLSRPTAEFRDQTNNVVTLRFDHPAMRTDQLHRCTSKTFFKPCWTRCCTRRIASEIVFRTTMRLGPQKSPPLQNVAYTHMLFSVTRSQDVPTPSSGTSNDCSAVNHTAYAPNQ